MLMILLYIYINMCQSRCIKYDVHVNTVVCLPKCISVCFWSDTSHTCSFGSINTFVVLIPDLHCISKVSIINELFKIIVAESSSHFLSQLVCHGLITVLVWFMN